MDRSGCPLCASELDSLARCTRCGAAASAGRYRVEQLLTQRAYSRLYLARGEDGRAVALKELLFAVVPSAQQLDAFAREARLLEQLDHPQTPRFLDFFHVGEGTALRLYLANEFIEGSSLAERLEGSRLNEAEWVELARQVLTILVYLHGRTPRVIHRDIKPSNLIVRPDGSIALIDFGTARHLVTDATHGATLVGTFGYMAPEQLGGTVDETSDLYALGATLLHAVSGRPPQPGEDNPLRLELAPARSLSAPRRAFLERLLEPRRARRFPSAAAALHALTAPAPARWPWLVGSMAVAAALIVALPLAATHPGASPIGPESAPHAAEAAVPPRPPAPREPPPSAQGPTPSELEKEAFAGLKGMFITEKAYFGEHDRYTDDLVQLGFSPDPWCADGSRLKLPVSTRPSEATGCHFIYRAQLMSADPQAGVRLFARGVLGEARNLVYEVTTEGPNAGIPRRLHPRDK